MCAGTHTAPGTPTGTPILQSPPTFFGKIPHVCRCAGRLLRLVRFKRKFNRGSGTPGFLGKTQHPYDKSVCRLGRHTAGTRADCHTSSKRLSYQLALYAQ